MQKTTTRELPNSEIEIIGSIETEIFSSFEGRALKNLNESSKIDGFRQGHIPKDVLIKSIGEMAVLEEMAEIALKEFYPKFIIENKIEAIGRPNISITKIAKNNPLEFKIITAVMPKFDLPNYKKIAEGVWVSISKEKIEITDKEVDVVIDEIRRSRADKGDTEHTCKEGCNHKDREKELPELNDDFARSLGNFKDLKDLREKIRKNLEAEKEEAQKEKGRTAILDKIIESMKIEVPSILVEGEKDQMVGEIEGKTEQLGIKFEDYLKQIKKTREEIRREVHEPALKRVKYKLVLKNIAKAEDIKIPEDKIMEEVEKIMKYYKNADFNSTKMYVEDVMTNEKVFELLENQETK